MTIGIGGTATVIGAKFSLKSSISFWLEKLPSPVSSTVADWSITTLPTISGLLQSAPLHLKLTTGFRLKSRSI